MDPLLKAEISGFTDWHINTASPSNSVLFPGPQAIPAKYGEFAQALAGAITAGYKPGVHSFLVEVEDLKYRVQFMREGRFAARTLPKTPPQLTKLGFKSEYTNMLTASDLKTTGGLILVSGLTGSGKSTTAAATVVERLKTMGGYCLTVEDPPEMPLEGFHGQKGYCEQLDASEDGYQEKLASALRCFPAREQSMLLFGEVRDAASAAEMLRIAVDGHLVISTVHAKDIITALQRVIALAKQGGEPEATALLANSLKLVMHQRLDNNIPQISALKSDNMVAATIRAGNIENLMDAIRKTQQQARSVA